MAGAKRKTIVSILRNKLDSWINTIDDAEVQQLVKMNTIVTGGSIASMLMGETINDYDVYFRNRETTIAVAKYYLNKFNEKNKDKENARGGVVKEEQIVNLNGETEDRVTLFFRSDGIAVDDSVNTTGTDEEIGSSLMEQAQGYVSSEEKKQSDDNRYRVVFMSQNAITLSNKIQIVIRFFGNPEQIHRNYDFAHCRNHYDYFNNDLFLDPLAMECILSKTLKYTGSLYPFCSLIRTKKFIERGWKITAGEMLKISSQIAKIDFSNIPMLREQLTGVDALYFFQLIRELSNFAEEGGDIDSTYICTLVDKYF